MATTVFFDVFYCQNRRKSSRVDTKTHVFKKGFDMSIKREGLDEGKYIIFGGV
jgi:hypothetical protein